MTLFRYSAYTKDGKKVKGSIEASHIGEAKEKIRELQLLLTSLKQDSKASVESQLSKDSLVVFTAQLSQLISAQIPVFECLLALEEQSRTEPFHPIILGLAERIKTGHSLSRAMQDFPDCFSPLYRSMIAAGEAVGNLELTLSRLTQLLGHQQKVRKQLLSSLTYPFFLAALLCVAVIILVAFVIPSLAVLFEDREVPAFTRFVLDTSAFLRSWGPLLLLVVASGGVWVFFQFRSREKKGQLQRLLLKLPFFSSFVVRTALSRFGRTLCTLLEGGLPLTSAMKLSEEAIQCVPVEEIVAAIREKLIEGRSFSSELARYPEIPPLFCRMVKIGEDSGKLSPLLGQVATMYEEESERAVQKLVTLTQPVLLLIMGIFIGGVLLSILLPLSDFGSTLQM